MDKKSFIKGLLAGVLSVIVVASSCKFVYNFTILANDSYTMESKVKLIQEYLDKYYVDDIDQEDMEEMMYAGFVAGVGDPYTNYFSYEEFQSFMDDTKGSFEGIGVEVMKNPQESGIQVINTIENSPAAKAGILPFDRIIEVDGEDISDMDLQSVVNMMKGPDGTEVKIGIYRDSDNKTKEFTLKRGKIEMSTVSHKMMDNKIGYLKLSGFKENSYDQFMEAYQDLQNQGMKGLILDLRYNLGGLVDVATKITDELVPEGIMVYTVDKEGNREDFESDANQIEVPLVLLVNGYSASASEILSGAVQDLDAGDLVGTQTYGKGVVQGLFKLADGSALKITIQKYYTPNGVCIQGVGITPDYVVEPPEEYIDSYAIPEEQDTQLKQAVNLILDQMK